MLTPRAASSLRVPFVTRSHLRFPRHRDTPPMNLLLGIPTRPFASMRRANGLARGTACSVFRNELEKDFRPCSPESFGGAWATITVKLMFLPSILRTSKRGEQGSVLTLALISADRCTQASTPSCPLPFAPLVYATKFCCSRVTLPLMHDSCTPTTWHPCKLMSLSMWSMVLFVSTPYL